MSDSDSSPLLRNPVVLIHGWGDDPELFLLWQGAEKALRDRGIDVLVPKLPPITSIKARTDSLVAQIERRYKGKKVHLIAHSMGGLNARDVAWNNGNYTFTVLTVTTLGTPHHGITALDLLYNPTTLPLVTACHDVLVGFLGQYFGDMDALRDMAANNTIGKFNKERPDRDDVKYFSWTGEVTPLVPNVFSAIQGPLFLLEGPNDGLISVKSATWGVYMGNLQGIDHASLMRASVIMDTISYLVDVEHDRKIVVKPVKNDATSILARRMESAAARAVLPADIASGAAHQLLGTLKGFH